MLVRCISSVCLVVAGLSTATPVAADRLSESWQNQRDYYNDYTNRACRGESAALQILREAALDEQQAVALNNLGWIHRNPVSCPDAPIARDPEMGVFGYRESAIRYYPIGMYNYGYMRFYGDPGVERDLGDGLSWLELAAQEGYASAAEELALIYAEGRGGVSRSIEVADNYFNLASRLGLANDRLVALGQTINAAARSAPGGQPTVAAGTSPDTASDTGPVTVDGGAGAGVFEVVIIAATNYGGTPRLGDRPFESSNWYNEVVYVSQMFAGQGTCWIPNQLFIVGMARIATTEYADETFQSLLNSSDEYRQQGRGARYVNHFRALNEGIDFVERNQDRIDPYGNPMMLTLAQAQAYGPRCPDDSDSHNPVHYPASVRAPGY